MKEMRGKKSSREEYGRNKEESTSKKRKKIIHSLIKRIDSKSRAQ
jgi:hypothetical protein